MATENPTSVFHENTANLSENPMPVSRTKKKLRRLYDPAFEHDSCGVGFVATLDGPPSHDIIEHGIRVLVNLEHRGATNSDQATGDGAGVLVQMPDLFLRRKCEDEDIHLPPVGEYAAGMVFLPREKDAAGFCNSALERIAEEEQCPVLGWRDVPVDPGAAGDLARKTRPGIRQIFLGRGKHNAGAFERKLYVIRRLAEKEIACETGHDCSAFYVPSLSSRTMVYKGFMNGADLPRFYPDLESPEFRSRFAMIHQRYSTNTFPSWSLAHPFRYVAHNGEINTLSGNRNHMRSREADLSSPLFGEDIEKILPVIAPGGSDSATFDNVLELLVMAGRSLPHALMMMIPEAWGAKYLMSEDKRAFYEYHAAFMEPWDGPAAMAFTDGRYLGAMLDRNGLRPARYTVSSDGLVVLASETGVLDIPPDKVRAHGRLQPGRMFLLDMDMNRIIPDAVIKSEISRRRPYRHWVKNNRIELRGLLAPSEIQPEDPEVLRRRQRAFGYTEEDLKRILAPMGARGQEPVGSMGDDAAPAVLSDRPRLLFDYFKQLFAQVTNPPIDPLREELVMSLMRFSGRERNLLDETPEHCRQLKLHHPILTPDDMRRLRSADHPDVVPGEIDILFDADGGGVALKAALDGCFDRAEAMIEQGITIIILTDRNLSTGRIPIPSLLVASGLHHHLVRKRIRSRVSIVVETGEAREIMHFALLIGYGASAVCPYLAYSSIRRLCEEGIHETPARSDHAVDAYITAVKKGLMKTMSRIGISTIRSYFGAQIFEALGLSRDLTDTYFTGTVSRIGGIGLDEIARETAERCRAAFDDTNPLLESGSMYQIRLGGETHLMSPEAVSTLQQAVRTNDYRLYRDYARRIDRQDDGHVTLRGLLKFRKGNSVPLAEVEPVESIVRRFVTSAMSMGSLSREAHETLAIAMNRLGGRSNSGEGGEDPARSVAVSGGDSKRSAVRQVASARFGVTTHYLVHADELQIKIAQGAKPGEGGQLPGHKVTREIARVRHSTPGVTLISPPPHHDIYSIEDLAQLIHDLKTVNPGAEVSVKLVSEAGVGTVAAGVAKGRADKVVISGGDGGTGASPLTSIRHAGLPWELGLSETRQCLEMNGLRDSIRIQTDGQLRTGRDIAVAALLGADEFGFGTVALVALGCVLLRKCHMNSCSVGVATQDPRLRANFAGKPEHVMNLMRFLAEDLREHMASLGFRTVEEMTGRVDMLECRTDITHYKARHLDLSVLLDGGAAKRECPAPRPGNPPTAESPSPLDVAVLAAAAPALERGEPVSFSSDIRNTDRSAGSRVSGEIAWRYGEAGLPDGTVSLEFRGSAGQSFGAFLAPGVSIRLEGTANDYLGKGMSGGRIVALPPEGSSFRAHENVIAGNTVLYGATGGEVYLRGVAGERFAVRNSGAVAVVEGLGDHGCEYMTGGTVVVLGDTGNNFAAGMSGGIAFVHNESGLFDTRCNLDMVDIESVTSDEDVKLLRRLVSRHAELTGSERAADILANWDSALPHFVKVMPVDYRLSLQRIRSEEDPENEALPATEEVFLPPYMEHARKNPAKRPVATRVRDWREIEKVLSPKQAEIQATRCRDCGIPYCHGSGCPLGNLIPDWNLLVAGHAWREALDVLHATNNFPEITGRVCPAPCEAACTLSINMPAVAIRHIERAIAERGWERGWIVPRPAPHKTGRRVTVIGSGPAGLVAAQILARRGHTVTVYERDDRIGGMLRYGIPDFKLDKGIIDRRIDQMRAEGVAFETGVNIGEDLSGAYIRRSADAILVATGARRPRDLNVPGRGLGGVQFAMDFLSRWNRINAGDRIADDPTMSPDGRDVLVIGGGDTGADCVGTSRRLGANVIRQAEILPKPPETRSPDNPWPSWPNVLRTSTSHEEGCERLWGVTVKAFEGNGRVRAARLARVEWTVADGRRVCREVPGSEFEVPAGLVLIAMGFLHTEHGPFMKELGLACDERGNLAAGESFMTGIPGIFAAGDCVTGPSLVVRAMNQGRLAAEAVDRWLRGS